MSFVSDVLPLLGSILAVVAVLFLTYFASKYIAKKMPATSNGKSIKVIERMALAQDKFIAIVSIDSKFYLIGVSTNNISLLKELDDYTPPLEEENTPTFTEMMKTYKKESKNK